MRTFIIIWSGQIVSAIGSAMTRFALTVWVWQLTGEVTTISFWFSLHPVTTQFIGYDDGLLIFLVCSTIDHTIGTIIGTVASLISGPLADRVFEPAMKPGGLLAFIFSPILFLDLFLY